jgi:glucokinase
MISHGGVLIGVDVGGTTMSGGLVTPDGRVLLTVQTPTHRDGAGSALETLLNLIADMGAQAHERRLRVEAVGVGLPGIVDADAGVMQRGIERVPELTTLPLAERIQAKTGSPAFIDNDVNALALAEWTWGVARGARSFAMLAVGTGLGGAVILDGRLVRGRNGYGGEFGHVSIHLDGPLCVCGARGCVAAYVAGFGIEEAAQRRGLVGHDPATAKDVFDRAAAGEVVAGSIVQEACRALGAGLAVVVNGLNPDVIVVTGGVASSLVPLQGDVLRYARQYALAPALDGTRIHYVPGDKAQTVRGGAALVLYERARRAG